MSRFLLRFLVAAIAGIILASAGWWAPKRVMWLTPAGHDIAHVVSGAITVNETLLTPPEAYRNARITAARMTVLSRTAQKKLGEYYVGEPLMSLRDIAHRTLNPKDLHWGKTSAWMTNWRVDWVHLGELTLLPGNATVTASLETRSNGGDISRMDYTFHLVHSSAGWRINRENFDFQPGYGP